MWVLVPVLLIHLLCKFGQIAYALGPHFPHLLNGRIITCPARFPEGLQDLPRSVSEGDHSLGSAKQREGLGIPRDSSCCVVPTARPSGRPLPFLSHGGIESAFQWDHRSFLQQSSDSSAMLLYSLLDLGPPRGAPRGSLTPLCP